MQELISERIKGPKRLENEEYATYCRRRKAEKEIIDNYIKYGEMFWDSNKYGQYIKIKED